MQNLVSATPSGKLFWRAGAPSNLDLALALCVSGATVVTCCMASPETMLHWFILPVFVSGVLIGVDCFAWLRNRMDLFDPVGIIGAYGYYFFFIAPLLTVMWNYHTIELSEPENWRDWMGWAAVLNCIGLMVYFLVRRFLEKRNPIPTTVWCIGYKRFAHVMAFALPITAVAQVLIFAKFGGLWGFMQAFSTDLRAFEGMGWQFLIAETFPTLLGVFVLIYKRRVLRHAPWTAIALLACAFFATKLVFGGLRGSRSNTVWAIFWLCGAIHLWVKPVPRQLVLLGIALLVAFMYLYGFYKQQGVDAFDTLQSQDDMQVASSRSGRTLDTTLLADLARSEIQAYLVYKLWAIRDYDYAYGGTYFSAFTVLIPKSVRPDWLPSKVEKGTEALHGRSSYIPGSIQASQVYGLAGEAMLNFTPLGVPLCFAFLALVVVKTRAAFFSHRDDIRRLLLPFFVNGCILVINSDLDNLIVYFLTTALPVLVIFKLAGKTIALPYEAPRSITGTHVVQASEVLSALSPC